MNWQTNFRFSIAAMAIAAACMLAVARNHWGLVVLLSIGCCTSLLFTDWLRWFTVPRVFGNAMALCVVAVGTRSFLLALFRDPQTDEKLHVIGNLLTFLQLIVFHQAKSTRIYWQLLVLGLLSVVVAAAIKSDGRFVVFFSIYSVLAFFAAGYFFAFQQLERFADERDPYPDRWYVFFPKLQNAGPPTTEVETVTASEPGSRFFGRHDRRTLWLSYANSGLAWKSTLVLAGSFLIAGIFFSFSPRAGADTRKKGKTNQTKVGFSPLVSLDRIGELLQSHDPVAKVAIGSGEGKSIDFGGLPLYFQGVTLYSYNAGERVWQTVRDKQAGQRSVRAELESPPFGTSTYVQEIVLEPSSDSTLFSMRPVYLDERTPAGIKNSIDDGRLFRMGQAVRETNKDFRYTLRVGGMVGVTQLPFSAPEFYDDSDRSLQQMKRQIAEATEFDEERFPLLKAETDRLLTEMGVVNRNTYQVANALRTRLSSSDYKYSLNANQPRDPNLDPIEDFTVNHKTGHCQYFASALAMMLRSQRIPSRICVGFHGGQYNPIGRFYQLRQSDCHAWVEAFIRPEDIPTSALEFTEDEEKTAADVLAAYPHGAWLRLDPTPADEIRGGERSPWLGWYYDVVQFMEVMWNDFILDLSSPSSQRASGTTAFTAPDLRPPPGSAPRSWWNLDVRRWQFTQAYRDLSTVWRLAIGLAITLPAILLFAVRFEFARRGDKQRRQLWTDPNTPAFFRRLMRIASRNHCARQSGETPREFGQRLASKLAALHANAASAAVRLCERLYNVRFGGQAMSASEIQSAEGDVNLVATALAASSK